MKPEARKPSPDVRAWRTCFAGMTSSFELPDSFTIVQHDHSRAVVRIKCGRYDTGVEGLSVTEIRPCVSVRYGARSTDACNLTVHRAVNFYSDLGLSGNVLWS